VAVPNILVDSAGTAAGKTDEDLLPNIKESTSVVPTVEPKPKPVEFETGTSVFEPNANPPTGAASWMSARKYGYGALEFGVCVVDIGGTPKENEVAELLTLAVSSGLVDIGSTPKENEGAGLLTPAVSSGLVDIEGTPKENEGTGLLTPAMASVLAE
jgi:hypothetical protein